MNKKKKELSPKYILERIIYKLWRGVLVINVSKDC